MYYNLVRGTDFAVIKVGLRMDRVSRPKEAVFFCSFSDQTIFISCLGTAMDLPLLELECVH